MTGSPIRLVLDNEAVQALRDAAHRKHRRTLAFVEAAVSRGRGGAAPVVPTAVRVEVAWDRRVRGAATINRLRVADVVLDGPAADRAAALVAALHISVADAHLGAVVATIAARCTVLSSDVDDVRLIAEHLDVPIKIVGV